MIKAIVTDIEGTTSAISFVHDVLFPYAREHMAGFVREHANDAQVAELIDATRHEAGQDLDIEAVILQLQKWIDEDKKITPLKSLQGLIWQKGYQDNDFHGHLYADAYQNLKKWHQQGITLYVYSSGSVYAQKLLFGHTKYGDLTGLFSGYFDTNIGAKSESSSYFNIIKQLELPAEQILFLSDTEQELEAASAAGMKTYWLVRNGKIDNAAPFAQVDGFGSISLDTV